MKQCVTLLCSLLFAKSRFILYLTARGFPFNQAEKIFAAACSIPLLAAVFFLWLCGFSLDVLFAFDAALN